MSLPTPPREPDSVPVLNSTPLPAFPQAWQLRPPKDAQILTVKGTFDLAPGGPAVPAEEQELPLGPVPFDDAEETLKYPGDLAFFKPRCDVFLIGHAYRPLKGPAVQRVHVELGRSLAFTFAAIGDRRWQRGAPDEPARFESIPLRPERAFGGPADPRNPVGVGRHSEDGSPLPNLEWPDRLLRSHNDRPAPVMTTPVPQTWQERAQHAGTYGGSWVDKRAPYFPDDFRWDYFQAAPKPLQIPYPVGDEWYRLRGVRPNDEALEGRLPCLRMRAFAQPLRDPGNLTELPLNLDTVWFDADQLRLVLVWRGAITTVDQFGSDLASFFVLAEPTEQPCDAAEVQRRFRAAYAAEYEGAPEEDEPDAPEDVAGPPEGYVPPRGLTSAQARALGLPPWAATIESPPSEPAPPPPPRPALAPEEVTARLDSDESLAEADFSHCDLGGRDLSGRDLTSASFQGANLCARLAGAQLAGAVLSEANLEGVDLTGADLRGAFLDDAVLDAAILDGADLTDASLASTQAIGASFVGATLDGASVVSADWSRAKLDGASLVGADFTETRLEDASLVGANMEDVRLYSVVGPRLIADDAVMTRCRLDGAMLAGASFARVKASDSSMRKCDLSDCNFMEALLEESVLEDAVLDRANVNQVEAKECRWPRARARDATFVKSNLMRGYFEGAHFVDCDMRGANLYEAETFRARFEGCRLEHAILGESGLG